MSLTPKLSERIPKSGLQPPNQPVNESQLNLKMTNLARQIGALDPNDARRSKLITAMARLSELRALLQHLASKKAR